MPVPRQRVPMAMIWLIGPDARPPISIEADQARRTVDADYLLLEEGRISAQGCGFVDNRIDARTAELYRAYVSARRDEFGSVIAMHDAPQFVTSKLLPMRAPVPPERALGMYYAIKRATQIIDNATCNLDIGADVKLLGPGFGWRLIGLAATDYLKVGGFLVHCVSHFNPPPARPDL
jgi:hypothetical protein